MKTLLIDLDGTLTIDEEHVDYIDKKPNIILIKTLKEY
ncbi:capsular biosynthesis protein, partial [Campylobacter jejuni]|nr:capsular biosynthesis protein [Campylobacter jejuni]